MGASGGAFAYKFILIYFLYVMIWVAIWSLGFNQYYVQHFVNYKPLNVQQFSPSLNGNYSYNINWIPASSLNATQLQNLDNGTEVALCVDCTQFTIGTLDPSYYWIITGRHDAGWFNIPPVRYDILEVQGMGGNPPYNDTVDYTDVKWINTKTSVSLNALNITSNTSSGQILTASVTLNTTDLWSQIVLMFGFMSGMMTFSSDIFILSLFNFALFMTFLYCFIGEILIPFGIHIPFV